MTIRFLALLLLSATPAAAQSYTSPDAARAVVRHYYAAIGQQRYRDAYAAWSGNGRASGQSYATFARGFARTARVRATVGAPFDGEGAAGSVFVSVPVDVPATLKSGVRQHFTGNYVLRRVNGVPGATPAQLRWHLVSAKLRAVR